MQERQVQDEQIMPKITEKKELLGDEMSSLWLQIFSIFTLMQIERQVLATLSSLM